MTINNDDMILDEIKIDDFAACKVELTNNNAFAAVQNYSPSDFEQFIFEYLLFVKKEDLDIERIYKVGNTSDKGVDVYLKKKNGDVYYYQCKHYKEALSLSIINQIIVKVLYYTVKKTISVPSKIVIVGLSGVSIDVFKKLEEQETFKKAITESLETILKNTKLRPSKEEKNKLIEQIGAYNFDNIDFLSIPEITSEYFHSKYGKLRFDSESRFEPIKAPETEKEKLIFLEQISKLECSNEEVKKFLMEDSISDYYKALCLEYTDRFYFKSDENFNDFIKDIFDAEKYKLLQGCKTIEEVIGILENSTHVNTNRSFLDRRLHIIGSAERQGACHYLVENGKGVWKK